MTVYVKLPPNSEHLSITDKFFKTRRCPLFRGFIVLSLVFAYNFDLTKFFRTASYKDSKRKTLGGGGDKLGLNVSIGHENICWIVLKRLRW